MRAKFGTLELGILSAATLPIVGRNAGKLCKVEGCSKPARARRWCRGHYQRWRRTGSPEPPRYPVPSIEEISAECDAAYHAGLIWLATYDPKPHWQ